MNLANLRIAKTEKVNQMRAIQTQLGSEGLTEEYRAQITTEWDTLDGEVLALDADIKRAVRQEEIDQSIIDTSARASSANPESEGETGTPVSVRSTNGGTTANKTLRFCIGESLRGLVSGKLTEASRRMNESSGIETEGIVIPEQAMRAGSSTLTTVTGESIVEETILSDLDIIVPEPIYKLLGCRILPGLIGNVGLPTQGHNEASWADEGEEITSTPERPTKPILKPTRVGITDSVSKEFLNSSNPALFSAMVSDMLASVDTAMTKRVFQRLSENAGVADLNPDGSTETTINAKLLTKMEASTEVDGQFVMHRALFATAKAEPTNEGSSRMLVTGKFNSGITYDAYNAIGSSLVGGNAADSTLFYGDFRRVSIGLWGGIEILVNPYTNMKKGEVEITVNRLADIQIRNAAAFVKYTKMKS